MTWTLQFTTTARREIRALDPPVQQQLEADLGQVAEAPLEGKPLHGRWRGVRSWRSGDYRILYGADPPHRLITVYRVAHRREVYR